MGEEAQVIPVVMLPYAVRINRRNIFLKHLCTEVCRKEFNRG